MRQKRDRIPLTFKNSTELQIDSEQTKKSEDSQQNIVEFNYASNERIFGGDYSEKLSVADMNKKSISISELSGVNLPHAKSSPETQKRMSGCVKELKEVISRTEKGNKSLESQTRFGTSSIFGETFSNVGWELQNAILCSKHKGEEVVYWESEQKELLCGQCLLAESGKQMAKKANLKNIQKSLPHIRQTIEDTVNDVSLQWQFLRNKKKELQICQGSLQTHRKSWENKFKIEIKEFFSHCVDIKNEKVENLKSHFKGISQGIEDGLRQMVEKEAFLERVTNTFENMVSTQTSTEKTINFYCNNIKEIDNELENARILNEKADAIGGKNLFYYSNENGQIWFLKYLLSFYEKLSEYVFSRKTFFKEKLNSFEQNMRGEDMLGKDVMSVLNPQSSRDQLIMNSNHKTRVHPPGSRLYPQQDFRIQFPSQMDNENPSTVVQSDKQVYANYNSSELLKPKRMNEGEIFSEMREDMSKQPTESHDFPNDSARMYPDSAFKKVPSHFQSRKSSRKSNLFSHKKPNFTNPVMDINYPGHEASDRIYKLSDKKRRRKNFTVTPKNCGKRGGNKNFQRKSQAQEIEVSTKNCLANKSTLSKNESMFLKFCLFECWRELIEKVPRRIETRDSDSGTPWSTRDTSRTSTLWPYPSSTRKQSHSESSRPPRATTAFPPAHF